MKMTNKLAVSLLLLSLVSTIYVVPAEGAKSQFFKVEAK